MKMSYNIVLLHNMQKYYQYIVLCFLLWFNTNVFSRSLGRQMRSHQKRKRKKRWERFMSVLHVFCEVVSVSLSLISACLCVCRTLIWNTTRWKRSRWGGKKSEDDGIEKENLAILEKIRKNQRQDHLNVSAHSVRWPSLCLGADGGSNTFTVWLDGDVIMQFGLMSEWMKLKWNVHEVFRHANYLPSGGFCCF